MVGESARPDDMVVNVVPGEAEDQHPHPQPRRRRSSSRRRGCSRSRRRSSSSPTTSWSRSRRGAIRVRKRLLREQDRRRLAKQAPDVSSPQWRGGTVGARRRVSSLLAIVAACGGPAFHAAVGEPTVAPAVDCERPTWPRPDAACRPRRPPSRPTTTTTCRRPRRRRRCAADHGAAAAPPRRRLPRAGRRWGPRRPTRVSATWLDVVRLVVPVHRRQRRRCRRDSTAWRRSACRRCTSKPAKWDADRRARSPSGCCRSSSGPTPTASGWSRGTCRRSRMCNVDLAAGCSRSPRCPSTGSPSTSSRARSPTSPSATPGLELSAALRAALPGGLSG